MFKKQQENQCDTSTVVADVTKEMVARSRSPRYLDTRIKTLTLTLIDMRIHQRIWSITQPVF